MSVIDPTPIQILGVIEQAYKGKNGKPDGVMYKAQIALQVDSVVKVGVMFMPRALTPSATPPVSLPQPGFYNVESVVDVDYNGDVGPLVVALHPAKRAGDAAPSPAVKA